MSMLLELAGAVAGAIAEYAGQKRWSGRKMFAATFSAWFFPIALYAVFAGPPGRLWPGIAIALGLGAVGGLANVMILWMCRRYEARETRSP